MSERTKVVVWAGRIPGVGADYRLVLSYETPLEHTWLHVEYESRDAMGEIAWRHEDNLGHAQEVIRQAVRHVATSYDAAAVRSLIAQQEQDLADMHERASRALTWLEQNVPDGVRLVARALSEARR